LPEALAQRWIRFDPDDGKSLLQIEIGILADMRSETEYEVGDVGMTKNFAFAGIPKALFDWKCRAANT